MKTKNKILLTGATIVASALIMNIAEVNAATTELTLTVESKNPNFQTRIQVGDVVYNKTGSAIVVKGTPTKITESRKTYTYTFGDYCNGNRVGYKSESQALQEVLGVYSIGSLYRTLYQTVNDSGVIADLIIRDIPTVSYTSFTVNCLIPEYIVDGNGNTRIMYVNKQITQMRANLAVITNTTKLDSRVYKQTYKAIVN